MTPIVGLDIGGANLKAARPGGSARAAAFALWKQPARLPDALAALLDGWPAARLAVTMTGELCDGYSSKRAGVAAILDAVAAARPGAEVFVWSTAGRFVSPGEARAAHLAVASANWHALATLLGRTHPGRWLLIDTGSTTTDIIPLVDGAVAARGLTDPARLESGELVYTGARRTPACALISEGAAAEFFATTHDAHLVLGAIAGDADDTDTADGRPATRAFAHARLARQLGGDGETMSEARTLALARDLARRQRQRIADGLGAVVGRLRGRLDGVLIAGSGDFLARAAWDDFSVLSGDRVGVERLADEWGSQASAAACAVAVARLLEGGGC